MNANVGTLVIKGIAVIILNFSLSVTAIAQGNVAITHGDEGETFMQGPNGDLVVRFKVHAEDTDGAFEVITEDHPAGFKTRPHVHRSASETFYIIKGRYEYEFGGVKGTAGPGSVLHAPPNTIHIIHSLDEGQVLMMYSPPGLYNRTKTMKAMSPEEIEAAGGRGKVSAGLGHTPVQFLSEEEKAKVNPPQ